MTKQLEKYGLQAERFTAIDSPLGIYGCGMSHLAVLKLAKQRNYKNVLILEDDFEFLVSPDFNGLPDFDVCMLSYNLIQSQPLNSQFIRILDAHTASGYIVNSHYYDTLINLYETAMPLLLSTEQHWNYANDMVWKPLQLKDNWIGFYPRVGKQIPGYSDNSKEFRSFDC